MSFIIHALYICFLGNSYRHAENYHSDQRALGAREVVVNVVLLARHYILIKLHIGVHTGLTFIIKFKTNPGFMPFISFYFVAFLHHNLKPGL